jgi:hypothetical protein
VREHDGEQQHYVHSVLLLYGICESDCGGGIGGLYESGCGGEICGLYESGCDCGGEICGICGLYESGCDCGGEICGICGLYVSVNVSESEIYVFLDLFYFCNLYVQFFCDHIYSVNENENDYEPFYII